MENMQEQAPGDAARPWYRHYWVWLVMAPPFASIVAGFTLLFNALNSPNPLVVDDYASIVRHTEKRMERDREAARLGITAELDIKLGDGGTGLTVRLAPAQLPIDGLKLHLVHPTLETLDRAVVLVPDAAGGWTGQLPEAVSGRYYLQLEPGAASWRLAGEWQGETAVKLTPPEQAAIDVR